jgi:hypothetical protein
VASDGFVPEHRLHSVPPTTSTTPRRAVRSSPGASSFADVSLLQRIWRDSNTAGRHAVADPLVNQEIYGKPLLGIPYEDNITPLI